MSLLGPPAMRAAKASKPREWTLLWCKRCNQVALAGHALVHHGGCGVAERIKVREVQAR